SMIQSSRRGAHVIIAFLSNLLRLVLYPLHALRRAFAAPRGAYVLLEVDGPVVDIAARGYRLLPWRRVLGLSGTPFRQVAREMANDKRVRGLLVNMRSAGGGAAALASLRDVLSEVRASGKDVVAYLPSGANTASLYVASAARLVVVGPETLVSPIGY